MANLRIKVPNHYVNVSDVMVRLEIRDSSLDLVKTDMVSIGSSIEMEVTPGFYVVEAEFPSGDRMQEALQVTESETAIVEMNTKGLSPKEQHAWAYLNSNVKQKSQGSLSEAGYEGAWIRLWRKEDDEWQTSVAEFGAGSSWDGEGVNYEFETDGGTQFLQVGGPDVAWKLIALPGAQQLRILIRPSAGPKDEVHPLDVTVATHSVRAETILTLLASGNMQRATQQMEHAGTAEKMLFGKVTNPTDAAIGGYYLLKIGDLDRLHDWTDNLANWIDWMADGPVIRAWHVLKDAHLKKKDKTIARTAARKYLLEAAARGVPIYTEGLRLLRDGLNMLSYDKNDDEVLLAKQQIDRYAEACDWSAPTTTFLGVAPDMPSPEPTFGRPETMQGLAFLFAVDTHELLRQGVLSEGETLTLNRDDGSHLDVLVEFDGQLNSEGKSYNSLQEVALDHGVMNVSQQDWQIGDSGESINEGLKYLRQGKMGVLEH